MMSATLAQQVGSCFLAHRLQQIQLLIQLFGPQTNPRFWNLGQPFGATPHSIDGATTKACKLS
jgi:hypothetical protein